MKLYFEEEIRKEAILEVAKKMMIAARTAPKGKGVDNLVIALVKKEGIKEISDKLKEMAQRENVPAFFQRDAENILQASAMVLIGTKINPMNLSPCGMCGFKNCDEKNQYPDHPCAFNTGDLGIAIGSAVSVAMEHRVDNRVMYTVGQAALEMGILGPEVKIIYGIPLSASGKNPFFDRK
ncbi:MAG: ferredoxin [Candidatus Aminicenantes bacterium]|nr:MAG: ferredoxin [Candidatus Aminicenantes bacterium]